ncbi:MAG: DUF4861 family protein, partial [Prolixibacteraceae bacterium]|nr:DUF4861 family protein [Prolixibacteraceae bacterium]
MGLLVPTAQFIRYEEAPTEGEGIIQTHLAAIKLSEGVPARYAFFTGWELQNSSFTDESYFKEQLANAALKLDEISW